MNTDLQKIYDEWGGGKAWDYCQWTKTSSPWAVLVPRLPEGLPKPTEDMMNRAVCLGKGPVRLPEGVDYFRGFYDNPSTWVVHYALNGSDARAHYCIDINDPHAREIINLNRPGLLEDEVFPSEKGQAAAVVKATVDLMEPSLHKALIAAGWTPPSESDWTPLNECDVQVLTQDSGWLPLSDVHPTMLLDLIAKLAKDGPESVRIRPKRNGS